MDPRLAQELELLGDIYCDEMEIKPGQNSVKLKVQCLPLLEDHNIEHHYEYDHPYLTAIFEVPNTYPDNPPKFYLESTHSKVSIGSQLSQLNDRLLDLVKTMGGQTTILDMIESIRMFMYHDVAKKNKHFKKRHHIFNDEPTYANDEDSEELQENLAKKSIYTEVTQDRFAAWMAAFRAEQRIKQERDPAFLRKKMYLAKPSGRMIFSERVKDFVNYFDDEKNEEDDEAVDIMLEKEEENDDMDIDEELFDDEDLDLEDEEFMIDDN